MLPARELRLGTIILISTALSVALLVASVGSSPSVLLQNKQLHTELSHIARTSALIDEPTDVADGALYNDPTKEARLGTVHSDDLFAAGMREAKAGERKFEQAVAKQKEKAVKTELASLRKSLPKAKKAHSAVGRAESEWTRLQATADQIAGEAAHDEKALKARSYSLHQASLSKLGLEEPHYKGGRATKHALPARRAAKKATAGEQSVAAEEKSVAAAEEEVKKMREANEQLRSQIRGLRAGLLQKGQTMELHERDDVGIRHQQRVIHQTRPGAVGGVTCAPPFCDAGSLPAVLPGEEP